MKKGLCALLIMLAILATLVVTTRKGVSSSLFFILVWVITGLIVSRMSGEGQIICLKTLYATTLILILINLFLPSTELLSTIIIALVLTMAFPKPTKKTSPTFEGRIKKELNTSLVTKKMISLPKQIGGFITLAYPLTFFVNKKWGGRNKEAIIHENVHANQILNKGFLQKYLLISTGIIIVASLIIGKTIPQYFTQSLNIIAVLTVSTVLVFFEKTTFAKTNELGKKYGIRTEIFTKKKAVTYFIFYTISISVLLLIIKALQYLTEHLISTVV